jgi:hypothetical protein
MEGESGRGQGIEIVDSCLPKPFLIDEPTNTAQMILISS